MQKLPYKLYSKGRLDAKSESTLLIWHHPAYHATRPPPSPLIQRPGKRFRQAQELGNANEPAPFGAICIIGKPGYVLKCLLISIATGCGPATSNIPCRSSPQLCRAISTEEISRSFDGMACSRRPLLESRIYFGGEFSDTSSNR